jgi:ABC-2 type transport system permease protein
LFGILLMMSIFMGSGLLQESIGDEKENRMMEVLLTSVSPLGVMAGKVLAMGAVGLGQVLLWVASVAILGPRISAGIPQIGGLNVEPSLLIGMVAFFAAGYFLMAVVLAGIGAATTSYRESSQVALLVVIPSASPMMLFQLISGNPDGTLARVLSFIPFTAPFTMILRMGATDLPLWEVLASLAVVTVSGVGLLWVSARVFRAGLLLYGQRMSLGRVWAALQEAG